MDYEKAYKEALERAKSFQEKYGWDYAGYIFPDLRESEDERIIKLIRSLLENVRNVQSNTSLYKQYDDALAWLEKQKENPKSTDSIPSDCTSDAKCEDRWYKVADFLPDSGRDVLAKDALGNCLLASFDGDQWFVSVYDGEDKPIVYTPSIKEWCDIPSEKQKEQKPVEVKDPFSNANFVRGYESGYADAKREQKPAEWGKEDEMYLSQAIETLVHENYSILADKLKSLRPQLKQEWSEEDETYLQDALWCVKQAVKVAKTENDVGTCWSAESWLKSLRPSWKPSEDEPEYYQHFDPDC